MSTVPRSALPRPEPTSADCRHSRAAFDVLFRSVMERTDLSPVAKLVHARLVSRHRLGADWTQAEIGRGAGLSRHQVWRGLSELSAAGLVIVTRHGQGRPASYVLRGIDADDLAGRARTGRHQDAGQPASPARARQFAPKNTEKKMEYTRATTLDPSIYTSGPLGSRYVSR